MRVVRLNLFSVVDPLGHGRRGEDERPSLNIWMWHGTQDPPEVVVPSDIENLLGELFLTDLRPVAPVQGVAEQKPVALLVEELEDVFFCAVHRLHGLVSVGALSRSESILDTHRRVVQILW